MNNNAQMNNRRNYNFYWIKVGIPINGELKEFPGIFEGNNCEVHIFTEYLYDKAANYTLKNKSINTIKNFHLVYIIKFLNFVFNDSVMQIGKIEDLRIEMVEEFLDKFSQGKLKDDGTDEWRAEETVDRANFAVSHFVYWLWWKKDKNRKKVFKMNFIKENDFEFDEVNVKTGYSTKKVKRLQQIATPITTSSRKKREKVVQAGDYMIRKLIKVAKINDPMMVFGIVLGAYAGLRAGFITQLHEGRIRGLRGGVNFGAYFDFTYEAILRSDNKMTSHTKRKSKVPIYPGCTEIIYDYYKAHIEILKSKCFYPNKYGALFINERGVARMQSTYLERFDKLNQAVEKILYKEAIQGNLDAIREIEILKENKIAPHSLRHYFKQLLDECESNRALVQYYMAQKSENSLLEYAESLSTEEGLRKCHDLIHSDIKNVTN